MIKYYKELENRLNYYLPLVKVYYGNEKCVCDYKIPISFIEKYSNLFKNGDSLIKIYKNFNIDEWFDKNVDIDYENTCCAYSQFESLEEDMYWTLEEYKKINFTSRDIENYLSLIKKLSFLYIDLFPNDKDYYTSLNKKIIDAINELQKYSTIEYELNREDYVYQPDAWYNP